MLAVTGKRTIENTLKPYDQMLTYLDAVANQAGLIKEVHPDEPMDGGRKNFPEGRSL